MGKIFADINAELAAWLERQHMFFTATAPSVAGHVNCSPKGGPVRILEQTTVAYLDFTGSGIETVAHLRDNGRIVLMFCAFEGPPRIVRLHGKGEVIQGGDAGYAELLDRFPPLDDIRRDIARSIIRIQLDRIADSCGFGVPLMRYEGDRTQTKAWAANQIKRKGPNAIDLYRREKNAESIDGLPGLRIPEPAFEPAET